MKLLTIIATVLFVTPAHALTGTYVFSCMNQNYGGASDEIMTFNPNGSYIETEIKYEGSYCVPNDKASEIRRTGSYLVGGAYGEGTKLDTNLNTVQLRPLSESAAQRLRAMNYCGINTWQNGAIMNITGLNCGGQPMIPFSIYTIFKLSSDENSLWTGDHSPEFLGSSQSNRPILIND